MARLCAARIERVQAQLGRAAPARTHPDELAASGVHDAAPRGAVRPEATALGLA
uniref:hypothetical protein n=1 Tax=Polaromonas sp. H6N TaxID=1840293 RepID=UPI0015E805FC|nr:hypothetical protein [Polaromonas sp. H6N]